MDNGAERLLKYLKKHKSATPMQIRNDLGISNPADAFMKLRYKCVAGELPGCYEYPYFDKLSSIPIMALNRYGKKVRTCKYSLEK